MTFDGIIEEEEMEQVARAKLHRASIAGGEFPYRAISRPYIVVSVLAMKRVGSRAAVFLNAENLLDVRTFARVR